jgi:hypothetical protein
MMSVSNLKINLLFFSSFLVNFNFESILKPILYILLINDECLRLLVPVHYSVIFSSLLPAIFANSTIVPPQLYAAVTL